MLVKYDANSIIEFRGYVVDGFLVKVMRMRCTLSALRSVSITAKQLHSLQNMIAYSTR